MGGRGPISVAIGHMVNPSSFWVYPLPNSDALVDEHINKVVKLEEELKESMEQGAGEQVTSSTPLSTLVAVALIKNGSRSWHRGKLEAVTQFQRKPHVNVFLIDYGLVVEDRKVEGSVMILPACFSKLTSLAFRIVLAGLQPASMDYDLDLRGGMTVRPTRTWDAAAIRDVERMLACTSDKTGCVKNLVKDKIGRYHGQLDLVMSNGKRVELNQWLVKMQYAVHSEVKEGEDMNAIAEADEEDEKQVEESEESFDSSLDSEVEDDLEITRNMASVALKPLPSASEDMLTRSETNKDTQTKEEERRAQFKAMVTKLQAKKKAAEESAKPVEESGDMWDAFRKSGNSEIDKSSRASSNLLPSGIFIGKFHENVLFNLHADGIVDQREKFERFVKKPCI